MWSAMSVLLEKTAFGGHAMPSAPQPADPRGTGLFEHPTAACPRPVPHAGPKVPAILRDWQEPDAERAVF